MTELVNLIMMIALCVLLFNLSAPYIFAFLKRDKPRAFVGGYAAFLGCAPCPTGAIPSVQEVICTPDWRRVTRMFFQKRTIPQDSFTTTTIISQSSWTTKITATNDTKISATPRNKLKKFGITPGEIVRTNDTPTGGERVLGKTMGDKVSFMLENITPEQYAQLQNLFCFDLVVFFATDTNTVIAKEVAANNLQGFPIYGRVVMNGPIISPDLTIQPRNFQVEFSLEDAYWYAFAREFATTFINIL